MDSTEVNFGETCLSVSNSYTGIDGDSFALESVVLVLFFLKEYITLACCTTNSNGMPKSSAAFSQSTFLPFKTSSTRPMSNISFSSVQNAFA